MLRFLKLAIVAIPLLTIMAIVPSIRLGILSLLGRSEPCSFAQSVDSFHVLKDRAERMEAIRSASHLLRSEGNFEQWNTRDGDYWIPKRNRETLFENLAEQEQDLYGNGVTGVRSGDVVLDAGANIGVYTRKALQSGAKLVIAIEPAPENVESLRRNFAAEIAADRVRIEAVGVWDSPGELSLNIDPDTSTRNGFVGTFGAVESTVKVPVVTIDSLVARNNLAKVDFIKLDIEGAEKRALSGSANVLLQFRPRLAIATEHLDDDAAAIPALIHARYPGYKLVCGPCIDMKTFARPDAIYFVPDR
ncbi:MAG: FkbM family methyltransferase [Bryobacteraceae bacterium]